MFYEGLSTKPSYINYLIISKKDIIMKALAIFEHISHL